MGSRLLLAEAQEALLLILCILNYQYTPTLIPTPVAQAFGKESPRPSPNPSTSPFIQALDSIQQTLSIIFQNPFSQPHI